MYILGINEAANSPFSYIIGHIPTGKAIGSTINCESRPIRSESRSDHEKTPVLMRDLRFNALL